MGAVLSLPVMDAPPRAPNVSDEMRGLINRLRFHATFCRAAAHLDLHAACAVVDPNAGEDAAARILIRVLRQALEREPVWYRPGSTQMSFDELWLAQAIEALIVNDLDSYTFLTHRRIAKDKRRFVHMLMKNLTKSLS
ncbi:MAG: hypothetical protein MK098_01965 [Marinovum sp.]|nr:hypothetical protein [Marinovum sp.]